MLEKFNLDKLLKNKKAVQIAVIVGVLGIVMIFLSNYIGTDKNQEDSDTFGNNTTEQYRIDLQDKLTQIIQSIEGAGRANVLITMENSPEEVYLQNKDIKTKEIEAQVRGVVVVCAGGENPVVCSRIINTVTKGLNIPSSRVYVTKLVN